MRLDDVHVVLDPRQVEVLDGMARPLQHRRYLEDPQTEEHALVQEEDARARDQDDPSRLQDGPLARLCPSGGGK